MSKTISPVGTVRWIGLRPKRRATMEVVTSAEATTGSGLQGDHKSKRSGGNRQVTFIQAEHLQLVGAMLGKNDIDPGLVRRNVVVEGINLLALRAGRFQIGQALFEGTGRCVPCTRMEENLGEGGLHAMYGHGGITARVLESGAIEVGAKVTFLGGDPPDDG